jgi:F-type H+-transporting ATPase subunit c
MVQAAK